MSRAFTKEDHEPPRKVGSYELPDRSDPGFNAAAAGLLLEAARVSEVSDAEAATGLRWGDPLLAAEVERIRGLAAHAGDERLVTVAERYLRAAKSGA
jgi:hypothetical protein